ncbi:MAG: glycine oxidase ThiO [Alphaproteobacteria bacterium]|nr:glycine oxidase ThiO [Alphaproteobacteria bacterium]
MKVVIIGAGVAGLGIGWRLAKAGVSVTVLERGQVGNGATTASAGMIAAAAEMGHAESAEASFARRSSDIWPAFADEIEAESAIAVGYRKNGSLMVALGGGNGRPPSHGGEHPGGANPHAQGSGIKMLNADQTRAMEPLLANDVVGALWAPNEAQVDAQAICRALAVAFVKAGGKVLSNETAVRIECEGGRVTGILTPFATHRADVYVLAAGAWTSRIEGLPREALPPVVPIKGEIIVLSPPEGRRPPEHVVWGNEIYVVPRAGRILVGATVEQAGFDTRLSREAFRWLRQHAVGLMPDLENWVLAEHWAGLRPASPDGKPILGPSRLEGLYVASGQYRNGILFAPAVADTMSRLILGQEECAPDFDPRRFDGTEPPQLESVIETPHRTRG